jgi:hypothetical protein
VNFSRNYSHAVSKKVKLITANLIRGFVGRLVNLLRGCLDAHLINFFLILLETFSVILYLASGSLFINYIAERLITRFYGECLELK